jgi:hypothetical protein
MLQLTRFFTPAIFRRLAGGWSLRTHRRPDRRGPFGPQRISPAAHPIGVQPFFPRSTPWVSSHEFFPARPGGTHGGVRAGCRMGRARLPSLWEQQFVGSPGSSRYGRRRYRALVCSGPMPGVRALLYQSPAELCFHGSFLSGRISASSVSWRSHFATPPAASRAAPGPRALVVFLAKSREIVGFRLRRWLLSGAPLPSALGSDGSRCVHGRG